MGKCSFNLSFWFKQKFYQSTKYNFNLQTLDNSVQVYTVDFVAIHLDGSVKTEAKKRPQF